MRTRSFRELRRLDTFEERYEYLKLNGSVGRPTFGSDRYMNQRFYTSREWKDLRHYVIARDEGCDLALEGYEISDGDKLIIHHMNPMTVDDIQHNVESILDPEYLISTTLMTHNAIHYGDKSLLRLPVEPRRPGDTKLW